MQTTALQKTQAVSSPNTSSNYEVKNKLCSNSTLSVIVVLALSLIALGAAVYFKGINSINPSYGLAMMCVGLLGLSFILGLYLTKHTRAAYCLGKFNFQERLVSEQEAGSLSRFLNRGEFFFFKKGDQKRILINHPDPDLGTTDMHECNYPNFLRANYKLVTPEVLRSRSL